MTRKTLKPGTVGAPAVDRSPDSGGDLIVQDLAHAPVIYYDGVTNMGCYGGIISLTLAFNRTLPDGLEMRKDVVAVAHLRCGLGAAKNLRKALDDAILLGTPTELQKN